MKTKLLIVLLFVNSLMQAQFTENFENYPIGDMDTQNTELWSTWSGNYTDTPIVVSDSYSFSGTKSGYVGANDVTDAILQLGNKTSGKWELSYKMYIPSNKTAYINVQGETTATGGNLGGDDGFLTSDIYFNKDNTNPGIGLENQSGTNFNFPHDAWFDVSIVFDIDNTTYQLSVAGTLVNTTPISFQNSVVKLGGIDFYSLGANNSYWVDDISFVSLDIPQIERDALMALYNATDGANWYNSSNWGTSEPLSAWYGVTVEIVDEVERVTGLDLYYNNLSGTLPSELFNLTELTYLKIKSNANLTGSIPSEIGNLTSLEHLELSGNNLTGNIPTEIGNASNLQYLNIRYNALEGTIPSEIGNLTNLQYLNLGKNNLNGSIPSSLTSLTNLTALYLYRNNFTGTVPDFTSIEGLSNLNIYRNDLHFAGFEDQFDAYVANLDSFWYSPMNKVGNEISYDLIVGDNYSMTMPEIEGTDVTYQWYKNDIEIPGATNLTYTITNIQEADGGNYTCKATSPIVTDLTIEREMIHVYGTLSEEDRNALIIFYYATDGANWTDNTNWNTTAPLYEWYGVEITGSRVSSLTLNANNLSGSLPTQIGDLDMLNTFSLYNNQLTGVIPTEIGNLTNLTVLEMDNNQLSGDIPTSLGNLTQLTELSFWDNQLTGTLPVEISNCTQLTSLVFEDNLLTGSIPTAYENLTNIKYFWLNGNQLTGDISGIFSDWTDLIYFSIGSSYSSTGNFNSFTGDVDLSNNSNLKLCFVSNNDLSSLDIRTGNNTNMNSSYLRAINNPNLTCIFVDDAAYSTENWTHIDSSTHFFETQEQCDSYIPPALTYVPDDNFEQALIDLGYDNVLDDYVITDNISNITELSVSGRSVENLEGIQDFTNLNSLHCQNNELTEIDLTNNLQLEYLICYNNELTNLNIVQNTALKQVSCYGNSISNLSVANNVLLESLSCSNNSLTSLDVTLNPNLTYLNCYGNQIADLDVSQNTALTYLSCSQNILTELNLTQNVALTQLWAQSNQLSSLNIMNGNNTILTQLNITGNTNLNCVQVDDYIAANTNTGVYADWGINSNATFTSGDCNSQTYVPDTNFEQALAELGYDRALNDYVPTDNIDEVTSLSLSNLNINDLTGIEDFTSITYLNCPYNNLTSIDVSNNLNLTGLICFNNNIGSIDVTQNTLLETLKFGNSNISNIDLHTNTNLKTLSILYTNISVLDLSNNLLLESLVCGDSELLDLDLSQHNHLMYLWVNNNNLENLNVRNGNNSVIPNDYFHANNNPNLTCIFVDDIAWSENNWANIDATSHFVTTLAECGAYTGTEDEIFKQNLQLFPNPTTGIVYIENHANITITHVSISNALGQNVLTAIPNNNTIDLARLPKGIYFITIKDNEGNNATYKVLKD